MKKIHWVSALACLTTLTITTTVWAAEQAVAFEPSHAERVVEFPFESPYLPETGPLRLKLGVTGYQDVGIDMTGDAVYDFGASSLTMLGADDGGTFTNEIGAAVTATVSIDLAGFTTDFEIGVYQISDVAQTIFTPYVLGSGDVAEVAQEVGPYNLVEEPFSVGPATGTLVLDVRIDAPGVAFTGTSIELDDGTGATASVQAEGEPIGMALGGEPGEAVEVTATQYGALSSAVSLHLMPSVQIDVFGIGAQIGPFDVEVAYPVLDATAIEFAAESLQFDRPATPAPEDPEDDDDPAGDDGGSDGGDGDPTDDDSDLDDDMDDPDVPELPPAAMDGDFGDDGGCTCSTSSEAGGRGGLLSLAFGLGLLGLRRRRRR
jgi:MYXO-CTERM domain-containing protein